MSVLRVHVTLTAAWCFLVSVCFGLRLLLSGTTMSGSEQLAWTLAVIAPPALLMTIFRGAPNRGVAQVLYETEQPVLVERKR